MTDLAFRLWLVVAALVVDFFVGDPPRLWKRIRHPVQWIGGLIGLLDRRLNADEATARTRHLAGILALAVVVVAAGLTGWILQRIFAAIPYGWIGTILVASIFFAQKSLLTHVNAVADALTNGGLESARAAVGAIVGRDPDTLDEPGICRAAIESTAENFSDGVVAPALWFVVAGLPGLLIYKAVNTADSMIGHRTPRHEAFGWSSAKLDDILNWPAARISALLIAIGAPVARGRTREALRVVRADARRHRSPNAGWPEAAMAGALNLALAGPRFYAGTVVDDPFLNATGSLKAGPNDIRRATRVTLAAWIALLFLIDLLALLFALA